MNNIPIKFNGIDYNNDLIFVQGGEFTLGDGSYDDNPPTPVKVSDFYISKYLVTQDLYEAVMGKDKNPSRFKGARRLVERVSWLDAVQFCNKLSELMGRAQVYDIQDVEKGIAIPDLTKNGICLPPEAAWEYATRGGKSKSPYTYSGSDYLEEVGWYDENSHQEAKPVGLKLPNALGLYDMSGNVWEWCEDDCDSSFYETLKNNHENPINIEHREAKNSFRVLRGGSWDYFANDCRVSSRYYNRLDFRNNNLGFRLFVRVY
jgi:formylglycine-generating enzyme required for sulfatase activity